MGVTYPLTIASSGLAVPGSSPDGSMMLPAASSSLPDIRDSVGRGVTTTYEIFLNSGCNFYTGSLMPRACVLWLSLAQCAPTSMGMSPNARWLKLP